MNRRLPLVAVAALAASPLLAQNCYDNPTGHQCFSFAPLPDLQERIQSGLNLRSDAFTVTGDIRLRLRAAETQRPAAYNANDQQATRARVQLGYKVSEEARAFVELNLSETWAGSGSYSDATAGRNFNGVSQAWMEVDELIGIGDKWRVGRSEYVLGNGLILGSCDFLQYPSTFTGVWASQHIAGHNLEIFFFDDYGPLHQPVAGTRYWGGTARINVCKDGPLTTVSPCYLAGSRDGNSISDDSWVGIDGAGIAPLELHWSAQWARRMVDNGQDLDAYLVKVERQFKDVLGGVLDTLSLTRTDSEGAVHVNPADFNTAGLLHQYGGAWRSDLDTNQLGIGLKPGYELDLDVTLMTLDRDGKAAQAGDFEVDVVVGKQLKKGVHASAGYGRDNDDREVAYFQLSMFF